jgi:hypothetical protein
MRETRACTGIFLRDCRPIAQPDPGPQAGRIVCPSRFDLAFLIKGELLAQEQILGCERGSGAQAETHKVDKISQDP